MRTITERCGGEYEFFKKIQENISNNIRVALPAIVDSFDSTNQTITAKVAIREKIRNPNTLEETWIEIPILLDVPICLPRAGNFILTMPITIGDEVLIIINDFCLDAWFTNSDIQNQIELRRHDLSDAIAIIGIYSQPNKISNYSTNSTQLRNLAGTAYIELKDNEINLVASSVKINGTDVIPT